MTSIHRLDSAAAPVVMRAPGELAATSAGVLGVTASAVDRHVAAETAAPATANSFSALRSSASATAA